MFFYSKPLFSLLLIFMLSFSLLAQEGLLVTGKMKVEGGKLEGKMEVLENGSRIRIANVEGGGKFEQQLKLNAEYVFSFSQEGYVTKKIAVNTTISGTREPDALPFQSFPFTVTLFKQYEGVNFVVFNQPVANIHYNPELDDFDYDNDYTKSIQEQLAKVEKEVEEKQKEEAKAAKAAPEPEPEKKPDPVIKEEVAVSREEGPTTPRRRSPPPPPPARKPKSENIVVLHSYTVGEMKYPNLNAYGFINFGDGAGRREITKEQFDEYAKKYH